MGPPPRGRSRVRVAARPSGTLGASMGPPPRGRSRVECCETKSQHDKLQWGRPREGGVGPAGTQLSRALNDASMGPPPRGRSRLSSDATINCSSVVLQWGRPREGGVGRRSWYVRQTHPMLQWGRPREGGVGRRRRRGCGGRAQASMGPPPRGRSRLRAGCKVRRAGWNGLQWGRPREGGVGADRAAYRAEQAALQWGRPREGGVGSSPSPALRPAACFNGAAPERAESAWQGRPRSDPESASMGPPPRGRSRSPLRPPAPSRRARFNGAAPERAESAGATSWRHRRCRRFNGAAPERAESDGEAEDTEVERTRFNGAAPERAESDPTVPLHLHDRAASMGPPPRGRSRRVVAVVSGRRCRLQWGRPREGGVGSPADGRSDRAEAASMGPPPRGRSRIGDATGRWERTRLQWGRPREGGVGRRTERSRSALRSLQWGRPREGGVGAAVDLRRLVPGGFNGAAPERAESVWLFDTGQPCDLVASMGPPPRGRSRLQHGTHHTRRHRLQWGRPREGGVGCAL